VLSIDPCLPKIDCDLAQVVYEVYVGRLQEVLSFQIRFLNITHSSVDHTL